MELIRCLNDVRESDRALTGGKGAQLGELLRAGIPVPPGFVLLTSAYRLFVESNHIQGEIERLTGEVTLTKPASLEPVSHAIRALFDASPMPDEIIEAVKTSYASLGMCPVAVRSSATSEDLLAASFAGQHETFLNVQTVDEMLAAIRHCWSSLWTPRALDYHIRLQTDMHLVSMAVVVQEMVPASASGVLFTANPVTGKQDEEIINAAWGLGESLVSGQVTPDMISVDKETGEVRHIQVGDKAIMTVPAGHGTATRAVELDRRGVSVLSQEQVASLVEMGRKIEAHFGMPQDIEWAIADEQLFILQARPITTLLQAGSVQTLQPTLKRQEEYDVPGDDSWDQQDVSPPQPYDLWTRTNLGENLPFPVTPLTNTLWGTLFFPEPEPGNTQQASGANPSAGPDVGRRFYGRVYINEGAIVHNFANMGLPGSFLKATWGSSVPELISLESRFRPLRLLRYASGMVANSIRQSRHLPKQARRQKAPLKPEVMIALIDQWVSDFMKQDLEKLDDRALWAQGIPVWGERARLLYPRILLTGMTAAVAFYLLERRVMKWTGKREDAARLVMALSGIETAEIGPALWHMAETLRESGLDAVVLDHSPLEALLFLQESPQAELFREQFQAFLHRFGHRCPNDAEMLNPRWNDAPEQVIALLDGYLRIDAAFQPVEAERQQQQERMEATERIAAKLNPFQKLIFYQLLKLTQRNVPARDNYRSAVTKFMYPIRQILAELGRRWTGRGWLNQPEDIFFLKVSEIHAVIAADDPASSGQGLRTMTAERRKAFDFWQQVIPPEAIGSDGTPILVENTGKTTLQGVPASGGKVRGAARIVRTIQEALQLNKGDILVTAATDPGWTTVFPLVSGLVLEIGGQLSHGAIIAREYSIPAVINVPGAMHRIRDGQIITVDGTNGHIELVGEK